ncbi:MAG: metal ABC transporter ATP-binding protein [Rickettsiaceae bacterium]|nr:metal ABC transporter ATP-binding protein [Rickettsiaceae bacterium]
MENIISFRDVTKEFSGKIIVEKINFDISQGTINVMIGPNGAGKSTIAKILLGIIKPSSGRVVKSKSLKISYVPQSLSIRKDMPITCKEFAKLDDLSKENLAHDIYESEQNIDDIWNKDIQSLSSGQLQLFLLTLALSKKPDLLVLDEPTAFLDVDAQARFYKFLNDKNNWPSNRSIFLISHELHSVLSSADQVLCINHHICCSGKPFKTNDQIEANVGSYRHIHDHKHLS